MIAAVPSAATESVLGQKPQIIAVVATILFLGLVVELVRRRRLVERYALLWIAAAIILVILAVWNGGLNAIADALGILSPPNALFLLGLGTVFVLALHFSVAFSRLSEETKILAQEVARLDAELRRREARAGMGRAPGPASPERSGAARRQGEPAERAARPAETGATGEAARRRT